MRLLVDISGLVYRSAYKLHLTDRQGRNVGAAYGTLKALGRLADLHEPEEMIICWDAGHEPQSALYPAYKADRKRDPEFVADLTRQKEVIRGLTSHLPVTHIIEAGIEADDLIAVLAAFLRNEDVGIVTSDTDLYCLSGKRCHIMSPDGVAAKLTLPADQYVAYKVMVGGEDGIKGVDGIGDVRARRLLQEHKTLASILAAADEQGTLGKMPADKARLVVKRNLRLMTPGALLPDATRTRILDQYRCGRLSRIVDRIGFRSELMEHGFVSIVSRLQGYLSTFKQMERHPNAKAETSSEDRSGDRASSLHGGSSGRRQEWTRYVRKVDRSGSGVREGERGSITKAASVLSRLRAQEAVGLDAPSNRRGAAGAVSDGDGQAWGRGAGVPAAAVPGNAKVLPKGPPRSRALSILHMLRGREGWAWLRARPTEDLQRVLVLIDSVTLKGKHVPLDDEDFLYGLEEAFSGELPSWMKTDRELKTDAKRTVRNLHQRPR